MIIIWATCSIFSNGLTAKSLSASARISRESPIRKLGVPRDVDDSADSGRRRVYEKMTASRTKAGCAMRLLSEKL